MCPDGPLYISVNIEDEIDKMNGLGDELAIFQANGGVAQVGDPNLERGAEDNVGNYIGEDKFCRHRCVA